MPCTTLLVGKDASFDGSTIIARNEDSGNGTFNPKRFVVVNPEDQPHTYKSVLAHLTIDLPDNPLRYTAVPNAITNEGIWAEAGVNEENISMSATETLTTNERVLGADPFVTYEPEKGKPGDDGYEPELIGGIGEEDMVTIVLPYIHSAREGVLRLGKLLEQYGTYEMNGIAFNDVNEIWWLETVGGHHWIAKRVPDNMYVTMPNQLGIDSFDFEDAFGERKNYMCSVDMKQFVADNHLDLTLEGHAFNPREAFGSHSDSDHVYNTPRAWAMQRFLNPHAIQWGASDALLTPASDDIPWGRVPERKVTIEDVKYALSLHYQGTRYDPYGRDGAATRGMYRPIGINRNSQLSVVEIRPDVDDRYAAIQWLAFGSNVFNALVPFYANVTTTPEYLSNTTAQVTTESFYWANRIIAGLADAHFHECQADIERYQEKMGGIGHQIIHETDAAVDQQVADVKPLLEAGNQKVADYLKRETDSLLSKVLYEASMGMKNGFSKDDM